MDPDQARPFVGPDLGPNSLQSLSAGKASRQKKCVFRKGEQYDDVQLNSISDSISTAIPIMECPPDYEIADLMYGLCGFSFHLVGVDPCQ